MLGVALAQTAEPSFEVASIRPGSPGDGQSAIYFRPGGFIVENATARKLMAYAYNVKDFKISGGPSWLDSEKFNITAKYEDPVAEGRQRLSWKQYRGATWANGSVAARRPVQAESKPPAERVAHPCLGDGKRRAEAETVPAGHL
jgi:Protein of unknown function (DUF3738)